MKKEYDFSKGVRGKSYTKAKTLYTHTAAKKELRKYASASRARVSAGFFKTGPGEYGEGDVFIGVTVPHTRTVAKKFAHLSVKDISLLLQSEVHEDRLLGALILCEQFKGAADFQERKKISRSYLKMRKGINNWDLVDLTAAKILGSYCYEMANTLDLEKLLISKKHWDRRIAIVATYAFIKQGQLSPTLKYASKLLDDREDLMHKATGWMLREAGKVDRAQLDAFIRLHGTKMPRTMLRYAIEHYSAAERKRILKETKLQK